MKVTFYIENPNESKTVELGDELTIGRTELARLVLQDPGLSRVNTTIFRDDDEVLIVDENSTNGTFVNGEKISGPPRKLRDGDEIKIGNATRIRVEMGESRVQTQRPADDAKPATPVPAFELPSNAAPNSAPNTQDGISRTNQILLIAAGLMTFAIIVFGGVAYMLTSRSDGPAVNGGVRATPQINAGSVIPKRVIDPLGGEDEQDLDDLISSWEVEEKEIDAKSVSDISNSTGTVDDLELNVTAATLAEAKDKAMAPRTGPTGINPAGLLVPKELYGDGVIKQKRKLNEMKDGGYHQPLDFAELAEKRLKGDLIEMPMASKSFYLDVGGSASSDPFTSFSFQAGTPLITPGSPKYQVLSQLAGNFAGQKYSLDNEGDRKQMRIRLLRMFNGRAKPILKELADAYYQKFNRPLRVTSLTRSMDYQISLNATNANSFKVRGEGSLPPHTSGCAFDLARKHMTAEEQNFVMAKLAQMESSNRLDALIEYGVNACFHIFIYSDGQPPR